MKLEINNKRNAGMFTTMWNLSNTPEQWIKGEMKKGIKKYVKTNQSGGTTYQNLWYTAKAVLREKFRL